MCKHINGTEATVLVYYAELYVHANASQCAHGNTYLLGSSGLGLWSNECFLFFKHFLFFLTVLQAVFCVLLFYKHFYNYFFTRSFFAFFTVLQAVFLFLHSNSPYLGSLGPGTVRNSEMAASENFI